MKIIVALDDINPERNIEIASKLKGKVEGFKINHVMWEHTNLIRSLAQELFIDCKLWDTPNTIKQVMQRIVDKGATMTTISTLNNEVVFETIQKYSSQIKLLGVTYLTSWSTKDLQKIVNQNAPVMWRENILKIMPYNFAGMVCSAKDIDTVNAIAPNMLKVCPGIGNNTGQRRTTTPKEASDLGADYLVIGRYITESSNPIDTIQNIRNGLSA